MVTKSVPRIFVRHKTRLGCTHSEHQNHNTHQHGNTCDDAMPDDVLYALAIFTQYFVESHIKASMETIYETGFLAMLAIGMGLQEDGTKRGRKGKGVDGRYDNRHSHSNTELAIERSRRATDKRYGDKHTAITSVMEIMAPEISFMASMAATLELL